jgi:hypothetical protein
MKLIALGSYVLGASVAAGMLAACSSWQSTGPNSSSSVIPNAQVTGIASTLAAVSAPQNTYPGTRKSWISPDKGGKKELDLLYVSATADSDVEMFKYPAGTLYGSLSGFEEPQGLCSSGKDVFVTNTEASEIDEYAIGATSPIATLSDSGDYPVACSYDPKTGNLAVSNIISTQNGNGNLAIYKDAKGTPTTYTCAALDKYYFVGYDGSGDVYVDGEATLSDGGFALCGLPSGGSTLETIGLNQTIEFPGQVQWDGKYVAVGDQDAATVYQFTISGSKGTQKGSTVLDSSDCVGFWIAGGTLICGAGDAAVGYWHYPAGGEPYKTFSCSCEPGGMTIAKGKAKK